MRVAVEGKFGQTKRRITLARVMPKLAETAQSAIAITFLVLNLERWLRQLLTLLFGLFARWRSVLKYQIEPYEAVKTTISAFITAAGANAIAAPATQRLALVLPLPRRIGDRYL